MRRVHLPRSQIEGDRARLSPDARHYLCDVLRLAPGAPVELFDGEGGRYDARLSASSDALEVGERREGRSAGPPIWLAFALAKGEKNELTIQKATELGASRLLPFEADRSVVRLSGPRATDRTRRWRKIAAEAARQCGRADLPDLPEPLSLAAALAAAPAGFARIAFHPQGSEPLRDLLREPAPGYLALVGPEGGLSSAEVASCIAAGCRLGSLSRHVLRAETAAIAAVALLAALAEP